MTKILISGGLAGGGVQTHLRLLCADLVDAGAQITVAATGTNWTREQIEALRSLGVRILTTRWGFGRWSPVAKVQALATWPLLLRREFDVLYCVGYGRMHQLLRRYLRRDGKAVFHELVDAPAPGHAIVRFASGVDLILTSSRPVAERWARLVPATPLLSIPFLTDQWGGAEPRAPVTPAGDRELRIVYLGRLVRHKRIDWLVREWGSVQRAIGAARLDVHGGDYEGERLLEGLRAEVRARGLSGCVALHGAYEGRNALAEILRAADVVVLPSVYEGLPLVLVEAMAMGVPVVATEAGGTRDLGQDNPDVVITRLETEAFLAGLAELTARVRQGTIDGERLRRWTRARYGPEVVTKAWRSALLSER